MLIERLLIGDTALHACETMQCDSLIAVMGLQRSTSWMLGAQRRQMAPSSLLTDGLT